MKLTKTQLRKIIKEEIQNTRINEVLPTGTPKGLTAKDKLKQGPAKYRGTVDLGNEGETGFFFLEKGENQWADTSASNAFNPASFNNDPAEFAQRIMKHLDDRGRPLTFNVYNGDPFEVARQNAVLQVINGEIIEPDTRDWDDEEDESNMLTDPEAYLEEQRAKKAHPKLTRARLMELIEEEVIGVIKQCR